jgi:hypothetical protein
MAGVAIPEIALGTLAITNLKVSLPATSLCRGAYPERCRRARNDGFFFVLAFSEVH